MKYFSILYNIRFILNDLYQISRPPSDLISIGLVLYVPCDLCLGKN